MSQVDSVIMEFKNNWEKAVSFAIKNVQSNFVPRLDASIAKELGNEDILQNEKDVKKTLLSQLLMYHQRFSQVIRDISSNQGRTQIMSNHMVPENTLKYEIKKYWNQG